MTCFSIQKSLRLALPLMLLLGFAFPVNAQDKPAATAEKAKEGEQPSVKSAGPIVLELFTASDCSACILADRILYDAMKDKDVIALSCHIEDMADAPEDTVAEERGKEDKPGEFTDNTTNEPMDPCTFRQWAFASNGSGRDKTIVIPMFYFNGRESTHGNDLNYFNGLLNNYHQEHRNNTLETLMRWKDKDTISIHLPQAENENAKINASIWIVRYKNMAVNKMDTGINKGRVLRFSNIVQSITHIGKWRGVMRDLDIDVTAPQGGKERGGYAILISENYGSPYLAAGNLPDYPVAADIKADAEKRARAKKEAEGRLEALPSDKAPVQSVPTFR